MRKKKDLPLTVLQILEPFVKLKGERFESMDSESDLIRVIDKEAESDFHFTIENFSKQNNTFQLLIKKKPASEEDVNEITFYSEPKNLAQQFQAWIDILNAYQNVQSFFDDPILQSFEEEYFSSFEILEKDADVKPFRTEQILYLDDYLEELAEALERKKNSSNDTHIEAIQSDIAEVRNQLTLQSKNWVVKKLSGIWAKIAKQGPKFIKEFLSEVRKEFIKQGIKETIESISEHAHNILK